MPNVSKSLTVLPCLLLLFFLSSCGGGKSTGAPAAPVDPSPSYSGVKSQATLSQSNAEKVTLNGFAGSKVAMTLEGTVLSRAASATTLDGELPLRQVTGALKDSIRLMQLPAVAKERLKARARGNRTVERQTIQQVPGPDGVGSASFNLEINDSTGSFYGWVTYQGYATGSTVISGIASMMGTFDAKYQKINRLTLSFKSLSLHVDTASVTLVGNVSWGANLAAGTDTETINMVWVEAGKTFWWNDLKIATTYGATSQTMTFSGRYYEPDYGYVDIRTATPVVGNNGYSWPSQGALKFSGGSGTSAELTFRPRKADVAVDGDGNGSMEWHVDRDTNDQAKSNTPPVAAAGPDQAVTEGAVVSLDGSASSDPDGDALSYAWTFDSCPGNACPAITDSSSSKASFTTIDSGTYTLNMTVFDGKSSSSDKVSVVSTAAQPTEPNLLQPKWQYGTYGQYIGRAGLIVRDIDGDGTPEIIASGSAGGSDDSFWYVLRRGRDGSYLQAWRSELFGGSILRMAAADVTGDGKDDIVVAFTNGTILVYDTATLKVTRSLKVQGDITAFAVADLDGDGKKELITSDGIGVRVYACDGTLKWSIDNGGGTSMAVGNVDGDRAPEIVTTTYGGKGYVIDGMSRTIEWEYANGFGAQVALAELDGDGVAEIVGASAWDKITIFRADRKSADWEMTTAQDIGALQVKDADGDGVPEIIYGDGQWGKVHVVDARTRVDRWAVDNPDHGVSAVALEDVDGDGKKEVLWGAGGTSSGPDHLYVADPASGTIKWRSKDFSGMGAVAVGDLDGDGRKEIVTVTQNSDNGEGPGIIQVFDAGTHALKYQANLTAADSYGGGAPHVAIADVDDDGKAELVVATTRFFKGVVQIYDGATMALKGTSAALNDGTCTGLAIADVDRNGRTGIITTAGGSIIILDGATMREKWRSVAPASGSYLYAAKVADLDGDGHPDIIAISAQWKVVVYDGVTHALKLSADVRAGAVETADVDGDGTTELLVGRYDGLIDVYDGRTLKVRTTVPTFKWWPITGLKVADLHGAGSREWIVASSYRMMVFGKGGAGLLWRSGDLSKSGALGSHIAVVDADGNGRPDVILGSELLLYQFEGKAL